MYEVKEFKIRCSAIGKIMGGNMGLTQAQIVTYNKLNERRTDPTAKALTHKMMEQFAHLHNVKTNPELPQGAKTYVKDWYISQLYGRDKTFSSKYTAKGIYTEDESIKFLSKMDGTMYLKNDIYLHDSHLTGTPDIVTGSEVIDLKNSWEPHTFPILETEISNKDYMYQVQGYMALTGRTSARVVYVLSNAPEYLIDQAANRERFTMGMPEVTEELWTKHQNAMTFDDIPDQLRIKSFVIQRDEAVIDQIRERVEACRNYLETIKIK